jgi:hypothetical protein
VDRHYLVPGLVEEEGAEQIVHEPRRVVGQVEDERITADAQEASSVRCGRLGRARNLGSSEHQSDDGRDLQHLSRLLTGCPQRIDAFGHELADKRVLRS